MEKTAIHTHELSIGYPLKGGHEKILHKNLNLLLKTGEITCLLGPNGSGKSTLIRTLAGFQKALGGEIMVGKTHLEDIKNSELAKKISVVLTGEVMVDNMNVFDMVAFGRTPYTGFMGRLGEEDRRIIEKCFHDTGIENLHDRKFIELSDGERQKVMIAKSLAQETPVIILDEPTAFLDFPSKVEILRLLRKAAWQQQRAVLLSTHDLNLAIRFADKIWLMGNNKPMQSGIPEDIILSGQFAEFFDRNETRFDMHTGNFEFHVQPLGNVIVQGKGVFYEWLNRALIRKGFLINGSDSSLASITVNENQFTITANSSSTTVKTVSEVLRILESFK